ncbi:MAG: AraC family transcriptional regulator [Eubacteriales bacterium]
MNQQYQNRINRVLDYIERNIEKSFTLNELAEVSAFSPYHFSRVFAGVMGEALFSYIRRLKLEKAKSWLIAVPKKSITEIALDFGFNDSSDFARAFKRSYGVSASRYRKMRNQSQEKIKQMLYNGEKSSKESETMDLDYQVEVKSVEAMETVYLRHIGSYKELAKKFQHMMGRLFAYGQQNNLLNEHTKLLAVYHDDHSVTQEKNLRTSVCLTVPNGTKVDEAFGQMTLPAATYAIGHFILDNGEQMAAAWQTLFGQWLPNSGYQPDDGPVFEAYLNDPNTHPEKKQLIDIYLPVKPL